MYPHVAVIHMHDFDVLQNFEVQFSPSIFNVTTYVPKFWNFDHFLFVGYEGKKHRLNNINTQQGKKKVKVTNPNFELWGEN
jgi:hypothetical protein